MSSRERDDARCDGGEISTEGGRWEGDVAGAANRETALVAAVPFSWGDFFLFFFFQREIVSSFYWAGIKVCPASGCFY